LSFGHRLTGVLLGLYAVVLVAWLVAVATGPQAYSRMHDFMQSSVGKTVLVAGSFCYFFHLCGGIRHLFWDIGYGFDLRTIYISGWAVVGASAALTVSAWIVGVHVAR
jgi:succinate dehydrogenase / fumarate reductase cytochrome b subunit